MGEAEVVVERLERVAVVRLNRPPVNALSMAMQDQIARIANELSRDPQVRAVVITGNQKAFAAGVDVKEMAAMGVGEMSNRVRVMQECFSAVATISKPVVAAVTGYALGGGCELALCADRRIAGTSAVFGQPEILLGIMPGAGGTQRLPRLIGSSAAKDMIFTGRQVRADEAKTLGLADEVVPDDEVLDRAVAWAQQFDNSPSWALSWAKEAIDSGLEADLAHGLEIEAVGFASLFATEDRRIGMKSFIDEGPGKAVFRGR